METVLFIILCTVLLGPFAILWIRSERVRHQVDEQLSALRERVARLEGATSVAQTDTSSVARSSESEPESFAEAAERARQLTDADREAARARLREHRAADEESVQDS